MMMSSMMLQNNVQDDGKKLYLSEEEYVVDNIYDNTLETLQEASQAWKLVERAWRKWAEAKTKLTGAGAIRYDNPLGCKVSGGTPVTMDMKVLDMVELEEQYTQAVLFYNECRERVRQLILNCNLTDTERRVMIAKYLHCDYPTFEVVAQRVGITQSAAFKAHKKAFVKVAERLERNKSIQF